MNRRSSILIVFVLCVTLLLTGCGGAIGQHAARAPSSDAGSTKQRGHVAAPTPAMRYFQESGTAVQPGLAAPDQNGLSTGGNAVPNGEPYDATFYENYGTNPFIDTEDDVFSTFALDVDTASYTVMRRYLGDGYLPDPASVRVEEYLNYFDYHYPQPESGDFAIYLEAGPSPFGGERYELLQIGIQARRVDAAQRPPASLTFVIDVSGSMDREDRLETLKQALTLLVAEMRPDDTIAIAVYGSDAHAVLPPTSGAEQDRILSAIAALKPEGSTNVEAGLDVGFALADEAFGEGRINMVLLCSDGVANNGVTDAESLLRKYERYLDRGIQLSTFGFGMGNFNDVLMERMANGGDGSYAYIDSLSEARRVFVEQLTGTLQTIARDAKVQVEFNPAVVSRYRLLGYENRDVADEDFRNDTVDAGEIGAGHRVTALYEIKRVSGASGPLAIVRLRYQPAAGGAVVEESQLISSELIRQRVEETTPRFQLAASVAQFAEVLRKSYWAKGEALEDVLPLAEAAARGFEDDPAVVEFISLLRQAIALKPSGH